MICDLRACLVRFENHACKVAYSDCQQLWDRQGASLRARRRGAAGRVGWQAAACAERGALPAKYAKVDFNPNSEIGMGGTGDPPVPSGHWPDGRDRTLALKTEAWKIPGAFPRSERRVAARHRPVACATSPKCPLLLRNLGLTAITSSASFGTCRHPWVFVPTNLFLVV